MRQTIGTFNREISVSAFGCTDVGQQRENNEDAFLVATLDTGIDRLNTQDCARCRGNRSTLLVVADGMGGAAAGEVASNLAVSALHSTLQRGPLATTTEEQLRQATEQANAIIWQYAQNNPQAEGMGTTVTAALLREGIAYFAHVGDSRAYLMRGQRIRQLTKDQSLVQQMLEQGLLTAAEAARHPYRNVVMQALGVEAKVNVALSACKLLRHDTLLLCSDGLSNYVTDAEIQHTVAAAACPAYACQRLIELANARGGQDNITVIVARFEGAGLSAPATKNEMETITQSLRLN